MGYKSKIDFEPMVVEWLTSNKSINSIAKENNIDESTLRKYLKVNKITKNPNVSEAISSLDRGLQNLAEIQSSESFGLLPQEKAERLGMLIQQEIIEIVRAKNPEFARSLQVISAKVIKKTNELLDTEINTTRELKDVTAIMKDINDTLQVIPKPASINQQINIETKQAKEKDVENQVKNPIIIDVKFIE